VRREKGKWSKLFLIYHVVFKKGERGQNQPVRDRKEGKPPCSDASAKKNGDERSLLHRRTALERKRGVLFLFKNIMGKKKPQRGKEQKFPLLFPHFLETRSVLFLAIHRGGRRNQVVGSERRGGAKRRTLRFKRRSEVKNAIRGRGGGLNPEGAQKEGDRSQYLKPKKGNYSTTSEGEKSFSSARGGRGGTGISSAQKGKKGGEKPRSSSVAEKKGEMGD